MDFVVVGVLWVVLVVLFLLEKRHCCFDAGDAVIVVVVAFCLFVYLFVCLFGCLFHFRLNMVYMSVPNQV